MKAIAVRPGVANSIHLREVPKPSIDDVPGGRGVLVRVLRVGVDGTDVEINEAKYGAAPPGDGFLILGHESFGEVVAVGRNVPASLAPGTYVVATVRRPGESAYDRIGMQDMTTDENVLERGISRLHGFLTEYYADHTDFIVPMPERLRDVGVLLEPLSIGEKGIRQAFEIQRRLKVWQPRRACVTGAGTIGMLAALLLRLRGMDVVTYSRRKPPYSNSDMLRDIGARYVSSADRSLGQCAAEHGPFDIIFEATGHSPLAWEGAAALAKNGVLVLSSVSGGDATVQIPSDQVNREFVLGNKVMVGTVNAARDDFDRGVEDLALAESRYPGWLSRMLTTPIGGLAQYAEMMEHLVNDDDAIKVYVEVAGF